jgi:hypothetical protein
MSQKAKLNSWEQAGRLMFIGVVCSGLVLLTWNYACDDLVGMWYKEYGNANGEFTGAGNGFGKWRTPMGQLFVNWALILGPVVYLGALPAALILVNFAVRSDSSWVRACYFSMALMCVVLLTWMVWIGLMDAVFADLG